MKLLEKINVGHTTLKNRIMFPPLTTGYEERDGSIGKKSLNFYKRLAEGGVGYIVIGDVVPVPTISPTPKLYLDSQIPTFKALVDACHQYDAKVGLQIFHPEYDSEAIVQMMAEKKPTNEIYAKLHYDMTHFINEVTEEKLNSILNKITECVKRAISAGVDVIEVHGDRLVGSLCSKIINHRTDSFGGSFANRTKFALAVVKAIRDASDTITIDYKLPIVTKQPDGNLLGKGGLELDEAIELAKLLEKSGVHMIHVAQANHTGNMNDTIPAMGTRAYAFMLEECKAIRKAVSIPLSIVGRIVDVNMAEKLINDGICDIVGFGRGLLCDPDIANKLQSNKADEIRQCMMCNKGCTDAIMARKFISCVLNPENGYEYTRQITKPTKKHNVAIVGGGIAGLEAARVAALKGHDVTVYEKTSRLYGQLNIASIPPRKDEMNRACRYYERVLSKLNNVKILLNTPFTKDMAKPYDDIIVAVGATNAHPNIKGINYAVDAWDILDNKVEPMGEIVVCGGGLVGVETTEYLINKGYKVTIVEMIDKIAKEESSTILPTILSEFKEKAVNVLTLHKIKEITNKSVICDILDKEGNVINSVEIKCDMVVNALASHKETLDLDGVNKNIIIVGDALENAPCSIDNATKTAYDAANSLN